jgi:hypothetical protein
LEAQIKLQVDPATDVKETWKKVYKRKKIHMKIHAHDIDDH